MKQLSKFIIYGALLILIGQSLFSCKIFKNKSKTKADSTISRTSESATNWSQETITEYIPYKADSRLPEIEIPDVPDFSVFPGESVVPVEKVKRGFFRKKSKQPVVKDLPPGYFRQTVRTIGQSKSSTAEKKKVSVVQQNKEKTETGLAANGLFVDIMIGLSCLGLVLVVVHIVKKHIT